MGKSKKFVESDDEAPADSESDYEEEDDEERIPVRSQPMKVSARPRRATAAAAVQKLTQKLKDEEAEDEDDEEEFPDIPKAVLTKCVAHQISVTSLSTGYIYRISMRNLGMGPKSYDVFDQTQPVSLTSWSVPLDRPHARPCGQELASLPCASPCAGSRPRRTRTRAPSWLSPRPRSPPPCSRRCSSTSGPSGPPRPVAGEGLGSACVLARPPGPRESTAEIP